MPRAVGCLIRVGLEDLADDEALSAHPKRLADQEPETDLAGALEAGLPCLHADDIGKRDLELVA